MRVGEAVVQPNVTTTAKPATLRPAEPVVVGLDGGCARSRHRQDERHFEVIAGKVIGTQASQSRFAFARNSPAISSVAFKQALAVAGATADSRTGLIEGCTSGDVRARLENPLRTGGGQADYGPGSRRQRRGHGAALHRYAGQGNRP